MSANLKDLRTRIKSIKNTQQITKAMKLVSAAKLGKAQNNVINSRSYSNQISNLAKRVANLSKDQHCSPLLQISDSKNTLVIVISSERGLCGGYNANITKCASQLIEKLKNDSDENVFTLCIGKKAFQSLARRKRKEGSENILSNPLQLFEDDFYQTFSQHVDTQNLFVFGTQFEKKPLKFAQALSMALTRLYSEKKFGKIYVVYSHFQSVMSQMPTADLVLPLTHQNEQREPEPLFEPNLEEVIKSVMRRYIEAKIYQVLLEATASEHGARMTAMDNATRNGRDMEKRLQITYQRARQAAITKELIEIISGAEAL